jgi:hypothetical protein
MREATDMASLREGIEKIDPAETLGYEDDVQAIYQALELPTVEEAKAAIVEVLRALQAASEGGFPVGAEAELADLVGFDG